MVTFMHIILKITLVCINNTNKKLVKYLQIEIWNMMLMFYVVLIYGNQCYKTLIPQRQNEKIFDDQSIL